MVRRHEATVQNELDNAVEANLTRAMHVQQRRRRRPKCLHSNTNARAASLWPQGAVTARTAVFASVARKMLGDIRPRTASTCVTAHRSYEGALKHLGYEPWPTSKPCRLVDQLCCAHAGRLVNRHPPSGLQSFCIEQNMSMPSLTNHACRTIRALEYASRPGKNGVKRVAIDLPALDDSVNSAITEDSELLWTTVFTLA